MYVDRMIDIEPTDKTLKCPECDHELGLKVTYAKENRPAYRLFQSSVTKKIVKQASAK